MFTKFFILINIGLSSCILYILFKTNGFFSDSSNAFKPIEKENTSAQHPEMNKIAQEPQTPQPQTQETQTQEPQEPQTKESQAKESQSQTKEQQTGKLDSSENQSNPKS